MVLVLYILGVASIKEFAAPLMVGILCGAYSSVCITSALWFIMRTRISANKTGAAAVVSHSASETKQKAKSSRTASVTSKDQPKKKNRKRVQERLAREAANAESADNAENK